MGLRFELGPLALTLHLTQAHALTLTLTLTNPNPDHVEEQLVEARAARAADDLRERRELVRVQRT